MRLMEGRTVEAYALVLGEGSVELMATDQPSNLPGFLHPESHQAPVNACLAASVTTRVKACTNVTSPDHFYWRFFYPIKKHHQTISLHAWDAADLSRFLWR